jgi:hypothetical protein
MFKKGNRAISNPSNFLIYCGFRQNYYLKNAMKICSYKKKFTKRPEDMCIRKLFRRLGYEMDDLGYDSRQKHKICLFYETFGPVLEPFQPPIKWTFGVLLPTTVWPGLDAAHSPPSISEFMDEWSCVSAPLWPVRGQLLSLPLMSYAAGVDSNSFTMPYLALPSILAYGS